MSTFRTRTSGAAYSKSAPETKSQIPYSWPCKTWMLSRMLLRHRSGSRRHARQRGPPRQVGTSHVPVERQIEPWRLDGKCTEARLGVRHRVPRRRQAGLSFWSIDTSKTSARVHSLPTGPGLAVSEGVMLAEAATGSRTNGRKAGRCFIDFFLQTGFKPAAPPGTKGRNRMTGSPVGGKSSRAAAQRAKQQHPPLKRQGVHSSAQHAAAPSPCAGRSAVRTPRRACPQPRWRLCRRRAHSNPRITLDCISCHPPLQ